MIAMAETGKMRIEVTGKGLEITPALREYSEKKVRKLIKFFRGGEVGAEMLLSVQRETHIAELTLHLDGLLLRAESGTSDMYASIDEAVDRVEQQVRKYKTRIQRRLQASVRKGAVPDIQMVGTEEAEEAAPRVVRTKRFAMKPMDVEEAIMQMELLGHDFFVFVHSTNESTNVVYRRRDGNYGLIEPQ
jgi:putative sigma-54 modulation protein